MGTRKGLSRGKVSLWLSGRAGDQFPFPEAVASRIKFPGSMADGLQGVPEPSNLLLEVPVSHQYPWAKVSMLNTTRTC